MAKVRKNQAKPDSPGKSRQPEKSMEFGLGGLLGKLGGFIEKLGELAESGEELTRSGEIKGLDPSGKIRGVYGLSVKTGLGENGRHELKVEPFGNIRPRPTGEAADKDIREPLLDVYEEEDHVLVLVEIPGISKKDIKLELHDDRLTLTAGRGEKEYWKEVTLPGNFSPEKMHWDCTNGILKIRLDR
ncbi:MAG: Hsp20/alpha crystallin family protein [Thermoguttaceae bacterium]|jgi:HSP20 family protein